MKISKLAIAVLPLVIAGLGFAAPSEAPSSELLGAWSNVKVSHGDDPHASGIEVEVWRHKGQLYGFMSEYVGPVADPPAGRLDALRVDEKAGTISFTAKLSVGVAPAAGGNAWLPTKNVYEFRGAIAASGMTGMLRRKSIQEDGTELAYEESIHLKPEGADRTPDTTFDAWSKRWNEALGKRGPKW